MNINKALSSILMQLSKKKIAVRNDDIFSLLRMAITAQPGTTLSPPIAEICDIIGYQGSIKRLENAIDFVKREIKTQTAAVEEEKKLA